MFILKLKFYLKSRSAAYFFKTIIISKPLLIFGFTVFLNGSLHMKNRFHYVKCFPKVTAKCAKNQLQIKKNVVCKDQKIEIKTIFSIQITLSRC